MSQKKNDKKNRWRSKTVGFRMSPEEAEELDTIAKLSGLSKQDYIIKRVLDREVTINGNPRLYKILRNQLNDILSELERLDTLSEDREMIELTKYIATIVNGLKGDVNDNKKRDG